jgi:hypothetical protein
MEAQAEEENEYPALRQHILLRTEEGDKDEKRKMRSRESGIRIILLWGVGRSDSTRPSLIQHRCYDKFVKFPFTYLISFYAVPYRFPDPFHAITQTKRKKGELKRG